MGEDSPLLQTKGIRDGLLVKFGKASWQVLISALFQQITSQPSFFEGASLIVDVGDHELRVVDLIEFRDHLFEHGVKLWGILSESKLTETTAQNLGLATRISKPAPLHAQPAADEIPAEAAKWVKGPLRSGAKITHDGSVVIFGDVNPGAEVIAGGNIIVWGRIRGVVHAGVDGDEKAVVCALELAPTQLRIADKIAVSPKKQGKFQPETARLEGDRIVAESWQHDRMET